MSDHGRPTIGVAALPEPDRDWLARVEALPVASVWHGGHVLPPSPTGEALTRLALLAAWTERVRVGTAVLVLPLYHPVLLAKQLADLDVHAGGRLVVGVGVGGEFPAEFHALGAALHDRGERTDEAIDVMRALWSGKPVSHSGRFFTFDEVVLRPVGGAFAQPGGPPVIVSGRKPPAMRRAAQRGDGWMPYLVSPEAYARSVQAISAEAARIGRDLERFEWMLYLYCAIRADGGRARDELAQFLSAAYGAKPPELLARVAPAGTPDEVAASVQAYVDAGARHIVIAPAVRTDTLGVVELAAREVLPRLSLRGEPA